MLKKCIASKVRFIDLFKDIIITSNRGIEIRYHASKFLLNILTTDKNSVHEEFFSFPLSFNNLINNNNNNNLMQSNKHPTKKMKNILSKNYSKSSTK